MPRLGALKRIDLRRVWPGEARDFTPWLAEHLTKLSEILDLELDLVGTEASVGNLAVDLLAKDISTGRYVIIENQFGATDHDHLGKAITYAAGYDASTVVWIAESFREEHREAIDWLNQRTDIGVDFFAVTVELLQIDGSDPAVNFRLVAFPNQWRKQRKSTGSATLSERGEAYRRFFQGVIDELRPLGFRGMKTALPQNWITFSSSVRGITYGMSFAQNHRVRVELYIDSGDAETNEDCFKMLIADREAIERELAMPLEWESLEGKRACRIASYRPGSISDSDERLKEIKEWAVESLKSFRAVFDERLKRWAQ